MPVAVSSLSVAVQGIAEFLNDQFGEDVVISVDTPQRASERQKGGNQAAHCLNIFVYRVAPSGFHAGAGSDETQFIRINALITPFPDDAETEADDADLRILGHAIRVLQANPILPPQDAPPLPGADITEPPGRKEYRLQAVLQAPPMEELNHIWTTQGGELGYRLSAAYEFALIPIEPIEERVIADPPRTAILDTEPTMAGAELEFVPISNASRPIPLHGATPDQPPPTNWLPVQMLVDGDALTNTLTIAESATEVELALGGPADEEAAIEIVWILNDESENPEAEQIFPIVTPLLDAPEARITLSLSVPANADRAVLRTRAAEAGAGLPDSPFANTLVLNVS
ncbi:MAG: DUF4255 domain-containing protein [Pseudomonadota bacterium]